jgi:hypothetical protein
VVDDDVAAGCYSLLLELWWMRGREKADVTWMRFRYSLTTTGTSLIQYNSHDL